MPETNSVAGQRDRCPCGLHEHAQTDWAPKRLGRMLDIDDFFIIASHDEAQHQVGKGLSMNLS